MSEDFFRHKIGLGWIEVIVGCMFSGKTEELIKQLIQLSSVIHLTRIPRIYLVTSLLTVYSYSFVSSLRIKT